MDDTCNVCDYKAINKNSINDNMKSVHDTKSSLNPYPNGIEEIHKLNECEKIVFVVVGILEFWCDKSTNNEIPLTIIRVFYFCH